MHFNPPTRRTVCIWHSLYLLCLVLMSIGPSRTLAQQTGNAACYSPTQVSGNNNTNTALRPEANTSCDRSSPDFSNFYRLQTSFMPANLPLEPLPPYVPKKVKIRFVILERNPNSFIKENYRPEDTPLLRQFAQQINDDLAAMSAPLHPPSGCGAACHVLLSRLRVELTDIEFIQDPTIDYDHTGNYNGFEIYGKDQDNILNVYFVYNPSIGNPGAWAQRVGNGFTNINANDLNSIALRNYYSSNIYLPDFADHFIHELGHVLGLKHFDQEMSMTTSTDYLQDIYGGTTVSWQPLDDNNFMFGRLGSPNSYCNYFSPMQLGRMHRGLYMGEAKRYGYPVDEPSTYPWLIEQDETWDFTMRMYQDIRVKYGATLTVKCEVQMPPGGRIVVEPGGKLIVDGGLITSYNNTSTWQGIQVEGNQHKESNPLYQGMLQLKNQAIIENAWEGVWNYSPEGYRKLDGQGRKYGGGGIIIASNSTFYNCNKAADISTYDKYSYKYNGLSHCSFSEVKFTIDEASPFFTVLGQPGYEFVTTENILSGMVIKNCTFSNSIPYAMQKQTDRGTAIRLFTTGITISKNSFDQFLRGIVNQCASGTPDRGVTIYDNNFNRITENITIDAQAVADIRGNTINNMINSEKNGSGLPGRGVYLDNARHTFIGCGNVIDGNWDLLEGGTPDLMLRRGVVVRDSRFAGASVFQNSFIDLAIGTQTQHHNPKLNITCNTYSRNGYAWLINPASPDYGLADQGTGCGSNQTRAGNVFQNNTWDIVNYINPAISSWKYYAFSGSPSTGEVPLNNSSFAPTVCSMPVASDPNSQCNGKTPPFRLSPCLRFDRVQTRDDFLQSYLQFKSAGLQYSAEAEQLFNQVLIGYNQVEDIAGLKTFLESEADGRARRLLIPLYIGKEQYVDAMATINLLGLGGDEYQNYVDYYSLLIDLKQNGRNFRDMTNSEWNLVTTIAGSNSELKGHAKTLLDISGKEYWYHEIEEPAVSLLSMVHTPGVARQADKSYLLEAFPNPVTGVATLGAYVTENDAQQKARLTVHDLSGRLIISYPLMKGTNNHSVNTSDWATGMYLYSLEVNGRHKSSYKLMVSK